MVQYKLAKTEQLGQSGNLSDLYSGGEGGLPLPGFESRPGYSLFLLREFRGFT
jgi:hypothetical protein